MIDNFMRTAAPEIQRASNIGSSTGISGRWS